MKWSSDQNQDSNYYSILFVVLNKIIHVNDWNYR